MAVIDVRDLTKAYGPVQAVAGVSLRIEKGEVYSLLGPNGAGKSTTIEILEGHRERSGGKVSVLGVDPATGGREFRDRIGIVLQTSGIEDELSVLEALEMYAAVYRRPRDIDEVLELVGLTEKRMDRVKTLSGGQQRRIDLALGIIGDPDVLFLDEPTTGFDPSARRRSWDLIEGLRALGTTILLTTHYMDEAQHLADRVGVIVAGELVAEGQPADLMAAAGATVVSFVVPDQLDVESIPVAVTRAGGRRFEIETTDSTRVLHQLTGWAIDNGTVLDQLSVTRPSLEDVYLDLAGGIGVEPG